MLTNYLLTGDIYEPVASVFAINKASYKPGFWRMQLRKCEIFIWSLPTTDCFDVLRPLSGWLRGVLPGGANKVCIVHHRVVLEYVYSLHKERTNSSTTTSKGGDDEDEDCDDDDDDDDDDDYDDDDDDLH